MDLEDRVERIEQELGIEDEWVEAGGVKWDADSMSVYRTEDVCDRHRREYLVTADKVRDGIHVTWDVTVEGAVDSDIVTGKRGRWVSEPFIDDDVVDEYLVTPDEYVEISGMEWNTDSLAIYSGKDAFHDDDDSGYLVAANDATGGWNPETHSGCDETVVTEQQAWAVEDVDDDILDEYLVTSDEDEPDWRDTFEDVFNDGGFEVIEISDNPAVIETWDYVSIGHMNDIHDKGWRVKCVHGPDHDSAHPEVRDADGLIVRFTENDDRIE